MKKEVVNGMEIYQATKEIINQVLNNQMDTEHYGEPHFLMWYYDEKSNRYVGCDNLHGYAWMEDFDSKEECINWLIGEEE